MDMEATKNPDGYALGAFYNTREYAQYVADEFGRGDDWTYTVVEFGKYFKVAIHDEDGEFVAHWI